MARPVSGTISMNGLEEKVTIRALRPEEYPLLADLLYEAIFVPEGAEVPPRAVVHDLALSGYWAAFGSRPGDRALCAVAPEGVVGAVWARRMRGYGFVADDVPELALKDGYIPTNDKMETAIPGDIRVKQVRQVAALQARQD